MAIEKLQQTALENLLGNGGGGLTNENPKVFNVLSQNSIDPELFGNKEVILKDLKENHVKIEPCIMEGHKGANIYVDLPSVGNFGGFKFEGFFSIDYMDVYDFKRKCEEQPDFVQKLYSRNEIVLLLEAFHDYMEECGVVMEKKGYCFKQAEFITPTTECLREILPIKFASFWLNDEVSMLHFPKIESGRPWDNTPYAGAYQDLERGFVLFISKLAFCRANGVSLAHLLFRLDK